MDLHRIAVELTRMQDRLQVIESAAAIAADATESAGDGDKTCTDAARVVRASVCTRVQDEIAALGRLKESLR